MVLKTFDTLGSMHGYGIAQRIQQVSSQMLQLNQGTLYPALLRLEQKGWIAAEMGSLGQQPARQVLQPDACRARQLAREAQDWRRIGRGHGPGPRA